jgi:saccharopine dehydrogenase-like NADP-dependent oxidoreductase
MMKNVCIFGSGMVSKPAVEFFAQKDDFNITLASKFTKDLDDVAGNIPGVRKAVIDAKDEAGVRKLLKDQDVVISLLPVMLHPKIATAAIATKTHFVSTSYVTKEMGLLSDNAKAAGIILLNECGLDPGLDHMSTMSLVNKLKSEGKTITSYESYGTGLPAPEYNDKPWGYKFSWSPKGVIEATRYGAIYKKDGQKIQFLPGTIFEYAWQVDIPEVGVFETYPNRDATRYIALYGLDKADTMVRGSLRNLGWSKLWQAIYQLGLLSEIDFNDPPKTYNELFHSLTNHRFNGTGHLDLEKYITSTYSEEVYNKLNWMGLWSDEPVPAAMNNSIDMLADKLSGKLSYQPGEKDMVMLYHRLSARNENGETEKYTSFLQAFGEPHVQSAMARTVSLPAALAAEQITLGNINMTGVRIPIHEEIYKPILNHIQDLDIHFKEQQVQ